MTSIGQHLDLRCTALGKAIAAYLPESQVTAIIGKASLPHNYKTITSRRSFREELVATRQRGYAVDDEEYAVGYCCLSAAVLDANHLPLAAISVMGSTSQISLENCTALVVELTRATDRISAAIMGATYQDESPSPRRTS